MINELKPCPFCGKDVELSMSPPIVVRCRDCKYGWQLWEKPKGKGLIDATKSAWNARADLSTPPEKPLDLEKADQQRGIDAALLTIENERLRTSVDRIEMSETIARLTHKIRIITTWLEQHQPDVFKRGLWDALIKQQNNLVDIPTNKTDKL